jgi:hypothetical protein
VVDRRNRPKPHHHVGAGTLFLVHPANEPVGGRVIEEAGKHATALFLLQTRHRSIDWPAVRSRTLRRSGLCRHENGTFYSGSAFFKESHHDEGNGLVGLWDVEVRRVLQFKNVWEQICDYQAEVKITLPQRKVFDDFSSFHEGCNPNGGPAWFTFPQFDDEDNHTAGEFRKIGSQRL